MDETAWSCLLVLGVLVVLAGCSAGPLGTPTPQEEPAPVKVVNNATITETFTLAVVDVGANLTVTRRWGETYKLRISPGSTTTITSTDNKNIKVDFPESAKIHGKYTLRPGESKHTSVGEVAPNEAIVILVYDKPEQSYRAIKSLSCGGAIVGYKVVTKAGGPDDWTPGVHQCKPDFPL